jgi:hypothetical protein
MRVVAVGFGVMFESVERIAEDMYGKCWPAIRQQWVPSGAGPKMSAGKSHERVTMSHVSAVLAPATQSKYAHTRALCEFVSH